MTSTKRISTRIAISLLACSAATPQGRPIDWPSQAGDAQRTGWEKVDSRITKDTVKDFKLVLKRKLQNASGPHSLTPPVVIGLLISYRGFKELGFVAGDSGAMWSIDLDVDRIFWEKHFEAKPAASGPCSSGFATTAALIPPVNFGARRPRPAGPTPPVSPAGTTAPSPSAAAPAAPAPPRARSILGGGGFGAPRPVFGISADGKLHLMNTSTGDDVVPAMEFLPANSGAASVTVADNAVYAVTSSDCGESSSGVWAIDLSGPEGEKPKVASFPLKGGAVSHHGGLALGTDNTVYVQTGKGSLFALAPKTLEMKQQFTADGGAAEATPVVFAYKGRDLIASAGVDGSLYLLDAKSLGTALYHSQPVCSGCRVWGGLSSWQDTDGVRWVLAPAWRDASHGSIVAFKLEEQKDKLVLTRGWESHDMSAPEPPVITSGVVFALSAGEQGNASGHATLYALDGATGKELYSTGDQVKAPANLNGTTVANGRVFFTTTDGTLYGFGVYMER